jgi:DNA-binding NtrC family response regulator
MTTDASRWPAFFRESTDPFFVLDRQLRLRFVNAAWEALTGRPAAEAYLLRCHRQQPAAPADSFDEVLQHVLCPPPEVIQGAAGRARRLLPGTMPRWWDVEFLPLRDDKGVRCYLGKIAPLPAEELAATEPIPERLIALRERVVQRHGPDALAGNSPAWRRLVEAVRLAARVDAPALLVGEAGSGKKWLARTIHYLGPNRNRPFTALDCTRLPPAALAWALFHEGSLGVGRPATLYLQEPGCLPREMQQRLSEALTKPGAMPRILAGCRLPPREEVRSGRLLEDLHCSLGALVLDVPPLRERLADLPQLVERFLDRANADEEAAVNGLTEQAWEVVRAYPWPGNLRELHAVLSSARRHVNGDRIGAADLPAYLRLASRLDQTSGTGTEKALSLKDILQEVERRLIQLALKRNKGNRTKAAKWLSVWRPLLWRRIEALGIESATDEEPPEE